MANVGVRKKKLGKKSIEKLEATSVVASTSLNGCTIRGPDLDTLPVNNDHDNTVTNVDCNLGAESGVDWV